MPSYCLFDNLATYDRAGLEDYKARVAPVVAQFGGRYVVLGGKVEVVEGDWRQTFPVMLEFPTLRHVQDWYGSPDYRDLKALRLSTGRFSAVILEGLP